MNISPTKLVVVVFPFVPVIPTNIGLFDNVYANSTSPIIFTLDSFNFSINGKSSDGKTDGGFLSIAVLIVAVVLYLILEKIATKFNLNKF